jgi:hypothetical protein
VKPRWTVLFYSSVTALVGVSWLMQKFGLGYSIWLSAGLGGMVLATACAMFALVRNVRAKWPAAAVLILAAPMGVDMVKSLPVLRAALTWFGIGGVLMVVGTMATLASAIGILAMALPPAPTDRIASARVLD